MTHVAYVSTYVPKRCGLATYTDHLRQWVREAGRGRAEDTVIAMVDDQERLEEYDARTWFLRRNVIDAYREMARRLNESPVDVVSLQHEFGIFGGDAGAHIVEFVRELRKPLVTTFHTVLEHPEEPYRRVQRALAERSDRIVVMSRCALQILGRVYGVPMGKMVHIPHGTPVPTPERRSAIRKLLGWSGRRVLMTFGLLGPGKGIDLILRALPSVIERVPDVLYAIVGQTHPEIRRRDGEAYREQLESMVRNLGLSRHVVMVNRYLSEQDLVDHILACDLYVTPYPGMQQITSGTLAYAVGLGRPVLSTPYVYARDLLEGMGELLIPYGDVEAWSQALIRLLSDDTVLRRYEWRMAQIGREMYWPRVGETHLELFDQVARLGAGASGGTAVATVSR
ncbi:glycosyltransferase family 4 protein [Alicyclobacillus sp.]|uniref:glycosyltransferase family 4 protein n=1 Tax=Alicyclobacillus sp. TaxID=61169 RepID=UPI0025C5793E|nr:glycosyltransferase family 4 protein [Alicyclobacillus sp.]MCL6516065.1 glycosyltransferase family 4 protein [Alicyclobacillus sp.]